MAHFLFLKWNYPPRLVWKEIRKRSGGEGVVIRNSIMRGGITQQTDGPLIRSKPDDCIQFEKSPEKLQEN